jgi:uncharacterized protein (UPF0276 family)
MQKQLGFGIGLRPVHYPDFHSRTTTHIDWLEVVSENFMGIGGRARYHLEKIRADYPLATHGVSLGIAGSDPIDERYLKLLKEYINWIQPAIVSDHLCWTSWKAQHSYDLLPFPLNEETLLHVCARIQKVQDAIQRPMLLENPSAYIDFKSSDRHEPDFFNELCARTGAGILLDLNNCMVNSKNLNWDPHFYIQSLKPEYVQQFHLAGHAVSSEICIDTHDQPVPDEVWNLYQDAVRLFPKVPSLIEWDGQIPSLERMEEEITKARQHHAKAANTRGKASIAHEVPARIPCLQANLATHQQALFGVLRGQDDISSITPLLLECKVRHERGLAAYCNNHFASQLEAFKASFSTLHAIIEDQAMTEVVAQYIRHMPPEHFSINFAGSRLPTFLMEHQIGIDFGVPQSMIAELATFDGLRLELGMQEDSALASMQVTELTQWSPDQWNEAVFSLRPEYRLVSLKWDILSVYLALQKQQTPPPPDAATAPLLMTRTDKGIGFESCPENLEKLLRCGPQPFTLADLVAVFHKDDSRAEESTELALEALIAGIKRSLLAVHSQ